MRKQRDTAFCKLITTYTAQGSIEADRKMYLLRVLLTVDMALLVRLLGLYDVWNWKTKWKCCWCECGDDGIGDLEIEEWPFRSEEKWTRLEDEVQLNTCNNTHRWS